MHDHPNLQEWQEIVSKEIKQPKDVRLLGGTPQIGSNQGRTEGSSMHLGAEG